MENRTGRDVAADRQDIVDAVKALVAGDIPMARTLFSRGMRDDEHRADVMEALRDR